MRERHSGGQRSGNRRPNLTGGTSSIAGRKLSGGGQATLKASLGGRYRDHSCRAYGRWEASDQELILTTTH
jgi:hypothetical protein